jgi:hypothetical protein
MRTATSDAAGWQSVAPGATLYSGTDFALTISVNQTAFIYVAQRSAGGETVLIYPPADDVKVQAEPSQPALLPAGGGWFRLDDHTGEEAVFVLLSERPQSSSMASRLLRERGEAACFKERGDPPPQDPPVRGRGGEVRGVMGDDGLAVLCFPFRHR